MIALSLSLTYTVVTTFISFYSFRNKILYSHFAHTVIACTATFDPCLFLFWRRETSEAPVARQVTERLRNMAASLWLSK